MQDFIIVVISALVATALMTVVMYLFSWEDFKKGDMVRAIGSIFTSYSNAFMPGLILHAIGGIFFGFVYFIALDFLGFNDTVSNAAFGTFIGACHGFTLAFPMQAGLSEFHPVKEFQEFTIPISLIHIAGHIIYGFILSTLIGGYLTGGVPLFLALLAAALILLGIATGILLRGEFRHHHPAGPATKQHTG